MLDCSGKTCTSRTHSKHAEHALAKKASRRRVYTQIFTAVACVPAPGCSNSSSPPHGGHPGHWHASQLRHLGFGSTTVHWQLFDLP